MRARLADRSLALSVNAEVMSRLADQGFDLWTAPSEPYSGCSTTQALLAGDFIPGDTTTMSGSELRFMKPRRAGKSSSLVADHRLNPDDGEEKETVRFQNLSENASASSRRVAFLRAEMFLVHVITW